VSRLLILLPSVPTPLDSGAKIRNHGLLTLLAAEHEVDAIAFGSAESAADLGKLVRRTLGVPPPRTRSAAKRLIDMARTDLPDMALRLWSPELGQAVQCFARDGAYDVIQAEGLEMTPYLFSVPAAHRIYDAHNAEFLLQRRMATTGSPLARLYSRLQWRRLERYEGEVVRRSTLTLAVSHHDKNQLLALAAGGACVRVVPNGIDTAAYPFHPPEPEPAPNLLFLGRLDFRPNAQAIGWFLDRVLRRLPEVRLFAVGAAPPRWLITAGQHDDRVAVTGYVRDERAYIERCAAMLLPLQEGGGSRLKALIAMASGLPIVSTRVGMEGLEAEPDIHYLLAESGSDWVTTLRRLLGDAELGQRLARNARGLVEARYDWAAIHADVRAAYSWLGPA
jgi:glycosyltransferase involved in cell wall biosynthesis